jgi:cobalt-zinc-cadmium efflux system membrane fusion protein
VYPGDLGTVRVGDTVTVVNELSGRQTQGRITAVSPTLDRGTRTATARVELGNPDGVWRPGLFVVGRLHRPADSVSVLVPRDAVQTLDSEHVVFVPAGNTFEAVPVQIGRSDRDRIEILSGLTPGAAFVSSGAFELKAQLVTSALDPHAGHGH